MEMNNILFTGGGGSGCELLQRVTKEQLYFADANLMRISPEISSPFRLNIPYANSDSFADILSELIIKYSIDYLIPCVDEELDLIPHLSVPKTTNLLIPNSNFVKNFTDKLASSLLLSNLGYGPKTYTDLNSIPNNHPLVIKPRFGRGSRGIFYTTNSSHVHYYLQLNDLAFSDIVVQDRIIGQEYTITVVSNEDGLLKCVYPLRVIEKKGITISAEGSLDPILLDFCKSVHNSLAPNNIYNIQLVLSEHKLPQIFEINPRVSTTFCSVYGFCGGLLSRLLNTTFDNEILTKWPKVTLNRYWSNLLFIP
ncbi:ATP-grasp domain-containing protein [bacterium]|nr:ATP-grasp domain-containing protein [bacterium]